MISYLRRHRVRDSEHGIVLPLMAMLMVIVCGMVAFAIDFGQLALARRRIQNGADAAVLAGVTQLPGSTAAARTMAIDFATRNALANAEVSDVSFDSVNSPNDTIRVTTRRAVPYTFAKVFGLSSGTVTAHASATLFVVQGVDTQAGGMGANTLAAGVFPYAVWGGNANGPADVSPGKSVTFRSNQYANVNVKPIPGCTNKQKNCNWQINSNSFKGYFHWHNRYTYIDFTSTQVEDQGGNAFGTEPLAALQAAQQSGTPIWLPLVSYADDAGTDLQFKIVNFVCIDLDPIDHNGGSDWTGTVLDPRTNAGCMKSAGLKSGGMAPPLGLWPLYTPSITQ